MLGEDMGTAVQHLAASQVGHVLLYAVTSAVKSATQDAVFFVRYIGVAGVVWCRALKEAGMLGEQGELWCVWDALLQLEHERVREAQQLLPECCAVA